MKNWVRVLLLSLVAVPLLAGCSRDPKVRRQKFFESGNAYFDRGKYREAAIEYLNAVQTDKTYAEAHYRLAQCYLHQEIWGNAYQELMTTVDLRPDNQKAQLDLGNLLLSARDFEKAQKRAEGVLGQDPNNVDAHILLANAYGALENIEESLREMQTAIQLAPDQPRAYLNMAYLPFPCSA